jgi:glycosyltransferase involved in cell wall biosynthesis
VTVIYNGVSDDFSPDLDPATFADLRGRLPGLTERLILFLGGADPRKNHDALLQAYRLRKAEFKDYRLVLVGAKTHHFGSMPESVKRYELEDFAVCTGPLSLQDIKTLYSHAAAFVFPSIYEGFGMPLLEAMACGAPVIASATTSLPEVAGDAAVLVNPQSPDQIADALVRVLNDAALRESLRAKGLVRAKQFTWERAAQETLAVYREVCL